MAKTKKEPVRQRKFDKAEQQLIQEIGAAIRKMRNSSGLTMAQMAKMGGSSASIVSRTERGVPGLRTLDFNRLRRWSKATGWHLKIVFCEPTPGAKSVQVDKPSPTRKKIVGPVIPPPPQKPYEPGDECYEPPGAW